MLKHDDVYVSLNIPFYIYYKGLMNKLKKVLKKRVYITSNYVMKVYPFYICQMGLNKD